SRVVYLVQALASDQSTRLPLWLVTRGGITIGDTGALAPTQAPLRALGRVIAEEHPNLCGRLLDLDPRTGPDACAAGLAELACPHGDYEVAFRDGKAYAPRLRKAEAKAGGEQHLHLSAANTYMIVGGTGALGLETARWLVERGARRLVLLARRDASATVV